MISRRIARPLLSSIFIAGGIEAIRRPSAHAQAAEPVIDLVSEATAPMAKKVAVAVGQAADAAESGVDTALAASPLDEDEAVAQTVSSAAHQVNETVHEVVARQPMVFENETYVRVNGAVQVGAGILLAFGRVPRLASAALAASLIPTTFAGHRFWEAEGDERKAQQLQFAKNMSLLGGLVLAATDTGRAPTVGWRIAHRGDRSRTAAIAAHAAATDAKAVERLAVANAKVAGAGGQLALEAAAQHAGTGWRFARRHGRVAGRYAQRKGNDGAELVNHLGTTVAERAADLAPVMHAAVDRVADAAVDLRPKVHAATDRASELAADLSPRVQALGLRLSESLPVGS